VLVTVDEAPEVPGLVETIGGVDGVMAAGRNVPLAALGNIDEDEPVVDVVKGCTGVESGAAAPAKGKGLNTLIPVDGAGGALPTMGVGFTVVTAVAKGAAAPRSGNGLKTLPPAVAFDSVMVVVVTVVCTVTAEASSGRAIAQTSKSNAILFIR